MPKEHPWSYAEPYDTHSEVPDACVRGSIAWVEEDSTLLLCASDGVYTALNPEPTREYSLERLGCRPGESILLPEGQIAVCTQAREWDICLTGREQDKLDGSFVILVLIVGVIVSAATFYAGTLWDRV